MTLEMPFLQTIALTYNERRGFDGHPFAGQGWPTKPLLCFLQKRMNEGVASFFALGGIADGVGGAAFCIVIVLIGVGVSLATPGQRGGPFQVQS